MLGVGLANRPELVCCPNIFEEVVWSVTLPAAADWNMLEEAELEIFEKDSVFSLDLIEPKVGFVSADAPNTCFVGLILSPLNKRLMSEVQSHVGNKSI